MKRTVLLLVLPIFAATLLLSCSSYRITNDIPIKEKVNSAAVLIRLADTTKISHEEYISNFRVMEKGVGSSAKIIYLPRDSEVFTYKATNERLYQEAANSQFLKYKTLGTIRVFSAANESLLKKYMTDQGVDTLIIYEIGGSYSSSLKAMKFDSVVAVMDRQLDVVYLDHQKAYIGDAEYDTDAVRTEFLDNLTSRWHETIQELGLISGK